MACAPFSSVRGFRGTVGRQGLGCACFGLGVSGLGFGVQDVKCVRRAPGANPSVTQTRNVFP